VVEAIAPGRSAAEVAEAGFRFLDQAGYDRSGDEFEAFGHGLGTGFEPPWLHPADEAILLSGMVICVEKTCAAAGMAASHEETVLVRDDGSHLLTR
jgi:Xaa-Pro aminopeptidase